MSPIEEVINEIRIKANALRERAKSQRESAFSNSRDSDAFKALSLADDAAARESTRQASELVNIANFLQEHLKEYE